MLTKEQLLEEIKKIEEDKAAFVANAEKQLIAFDGAVQGYRLLLEKYFPDDTTADSNTKPAI